MNTTPHERNTRPEYCTCADDYMCPDCRTLTKQDGEGDRYVRNIATSVKHHPEWRYGQIAFNELPAWLRAEVCGTFLDPFHQTDVEAVDRFVDWAVERIEAEAEAKK